MGSAEGGRPRASPMCPPARCPPRRLERSAQAEGARRRSCRGLGRGARGAGFKSREAKPQQQRPSQGLKGAAQKREGEGKQGRGQKGNGAKNKGKWGRERRARGGGEEGAAEAASRAAPPRLPVTSNLPGGSPPERRKRPCGRPWCTSDLPPSTNRRMSGPATGRECISTNLADAGLRSVARNNKATRLLTRPGQTTKSSAKDLSLRIVKLQSAS